MTAHTNFGSFSHQQLYAMLHAGDSGGARAAAEKWRAAGFGLFEQADNLMSQLSEFDGHWTGGAADKYKIMIDDLVGGIRKVGQTAVAMRHLLEDAADELDTAKAEMPPPVNVPEVSPADLSLAVNPPLLPADASPELMQAAAQRRATAIGNVEAQQQASNAANAAHSKAIQVMTDLAGDYTAAEESIPASPNAAVTPPAPGPGSPGGGAGGGGGAPAPLPPGGVSVQPGGPQTLLPGDGTQPMPMPIDQGKPSSPLFGSMFTAGLAAASAAAFGRFGSIMPKVPPWAGGKKEGDEKLPGGEGTGSGKLGDGFGGGAAGGGGGVPIGGGSVGGIGGGGVGGVGGVDLGSPGDGAAAAPGMAGSGAAGSAVSGLAGGAAGAAGAAAAKGMMPMMPFMPMGMGAGDMGSGRRIPPWLVETEDVWGESSVVAPSVIGEEPDAQR